MEQGRFKCNIVLDCNLSCWFIPPPPFPYWAGLVLDVELRLPGDSFKLCVFLFHCPLCRDYVLVPPNNNLCSSSCLLLLQLEQEIPLTCPEGSPGAEAVNSVANTKYAKYRDEVIAAYNTSGMLMMNISAEIVSTMSDYAISRTNYDENYIENITEQLGIAELGIPDNLAALLDESTAELQSKIDDLTAAMDALSVCSTLQVRRKIQQRQGLG